MGGVCVGKIFQKLIIGRRGGGDYSVLHSTFENYDFQIFPLNQLGSTSCTKKLLIILDDFWLDSIINLKLQYTCIKEIFS